MSCERGGQTLKEGKIGRVNCIRQQILSPGENLNTSIKGSVKLESLRERDSLRIHAHLGLFLTPVRWLEPNWPAFIKDGAADPAPISYEQQGNLAKLGLGGYAGQTFAIPSFWSEAYRRVYNEWYKWPEDPDITGLINGNGEKAVPIQAAWSRARYKATPDDTYDYIVGAPNDSFDIRDMLKVQGRFKTAMERDVLSYNRYMELLQMMYGEDGSREVDQVPIMVDQVEVGINPREIPAIDGASLGQWQSIFDFNIDHQVRGISFPEHAILTYMLTVRFSAIAEVKHPLATQNAGWASMVLNKDMLEVAEPEDVSIERLFMNQSATSLGFLPAGWEWRTGHDVIGRRVDVRDTFPYMRLPTTPAEAKDATRINPAFRSSALGDYMVDVYIKESCHSKINNSLESYYNGLDGGWNDAEFPNQGKML